MKTTKVCIIAKYLFPYDTRLCQQIKVLNRHNIPCDVICVKNSEQKYVEHLEGVTVYRVTELQQIKKSFFIYLKDTIHFLFATTLKLCFLSSKNSYKIIFVHTLPEFIVFTTLFHKFFGSTIVLDGRDITVDLLESRWPGIDVIIKNVALFIEKIVMGFCNEIITASNGFKRSLQKRGVPEKKITVLFNTADETIFHFIENKENNIISENARLIYHGTVSERFGVIVAIEAMSMICKCIPYSSFYIYGTYDPYYRKKIEQMTKDMKLEDNIFLNSQISLEEIYEQLQTMDLGIVPYLSGHFMNLALSTKTFEYIASGLPVAASRLKSTEELFDDCCIYYAEPGNPEDLAKKVIDVCTNPEARLNKRRRAFEVFKRAYTSELQHMKYLKIIDTYSDGKFVIKKKIQEPNLIDA